MAEGVSRRLKRKRTVSSSPERDGPADGKQVSHIPEVPEAAAPATEIKQFKVVGQNKVGVLLRPDPELGAIDYLASGDTFDVSTTHITGGRKFFQLADGRGWVPHCSRKDPSKVVVEQHDEKRLKKASAEFRRPTRDVPQLKVLQHLTASSRPPKLDLQLEPLRLGTLRELTLQGDALGSAGVSQLEAALASKSSRLASLVLGDNDLGPQGAKTLAKALTRNATINHLSISDNHIQDEGAEHLAALLRRNTALATMELPMNRICNSGAEKLAGALEKNRSLRALSLFSNRIGVAGVACFAQMLNKNQVLTSLELWGNSGWKEEDKIGISIRKALKSNRAKDRQAKKISARGAASVAAVSEFTACEDDSSQFLAVMGATCNFFDFMSLSQLFHASGCSKAVRTEVMGGPWRFEALCRVLDFDDFDVESRNVKASTRRTARRTCTNMRAEDRMLGALRLPAVRPHVRHLVLATAPTGFVRSKAVWEVLRTLLNLEYVTIPHNGLGWPDPSTKRRFERELMDLLQSLAKDRGEPPDECHGDLPR